jgi:hypothetical protein
VLLPASFCLVKKGIIVTAAAAAAAPLLTAETKQTTGEVRLGSAKLVRIQVRADLLHLLVRHLLRGENLLNF